MQNSPSSSKLLQYLTQKQVPRAIPIEKDTKKISTIGVIKSCKLNLENPHSLLTKNQSTAAKSLTTLSIKQTRHSFFPKSVRCTVPNLSNLNTRFEMEKKSDSYCSVPSLNDMKKFSPKNLTIRPYLFKDGMLIPIEFPVDNSGPLKTSTTTTTNVHKQRSIKSLIPLPSRPHLKSFMSKHPAPLPVTPKQKCLPSWKESPPAPNVQIMRSLELENSTALLITWDMLIPKKVADIKKYQIFLYHEDSTETPKTDLWKQVGEVNALPLPMACSISEFEPNEKYYIVVRALDVHSRVGPFSSPRCLSIK